MTRTTLVYSSFCQYWWHSVCTVHLFWILFLSFCSVLKNSFFFLFISVFISCIYGWWPAWVWPVWECWAGWVSCPLACFYLFFLSFFFLFLCLVRFLSSLFLWGHLRCFMWLLHVGKTTMKAKTGEKALLADLSAPLPLCPVFFLSPPPPLSSRAGSPLCTLPLITATSTWRRFYWTGGQQWTSQPG